MGPRVRIGGAHQPLCSNVREQRAVRQRLRSGVRAVRVCVVYRVRIAVQHNQVVWDCFDCFC